SSWQFDPKTDQFPDFIRGEYHALGDLEIDVRRWFNETELLTRDLLSSNEAKEDLKWALYELRHPWSQLLFGSNNPTRTECLASVAKNFDTGVRVLKAVPELSPASERLVTALPVSANSAFILMWM